MQSEVKIAVEAWRRLFGVRLSVKKIAEHMEILEKWERQFQRMDERPAVPWFDEEKDGRKIRHPRGA